MSSSNDNPWEDQASISHAADGRRVEGVAGQQSTNPWEMQGQQNTSYTTQPDPWAQQQERYAPPTGVPTPQATKLPDETLRFVPEAERGEQREALEQFEMSHHHQQSTDEQNIERLTQQFPKIDSALVAAIYGDSKDMGASREMLGELSEQMK